MYVFQRMCFDETSSMFCVFGYTHDALRFTGRAGISAKAIRFAEHPLRQTRVGLH